MKKCLILGGAGFLGINLVHGLLLHGYGVRVYNRESPHLRRLARWFPGLDILVGDFAGEGKFSSLLEGVDVVFHLASTTKPSNRDMGREFEENVLPAIRLLDACKGRPIQVIYFSSGGTIYGMPQYTPIDEAHPTDPISAYGIHKLAVEKCLQYYGRTYGIAYRILRISNPYGAFQDPFSNQGAIAVFLGKALMGKPIEIWGDGNAVRDYIHVSDVVEACLRVMEYEGEVRIFNVGSGSGHSLNEIVEAIRQSTGRALDIRYVPGRIQDVPANVLDSFLLHEQTGWVPRVNFAQGIRSMRMSWDGIAQEYRWGDLA